jgi:putative ABC transport system substrate-binding protein
MRRRNFLKVGGAALVWPFVARAQQTKKVVGMLRGVPDPKYLRALVGRLGELGWVEGRNLQMEVRSDPNPERQRELAAELVHMNVDVIFAGTSAQVEAARQVTRTIPIVFAAHGDPVGAASRLPSGRSGP